MIVTLFLKNVVLIAVGYASWSSCLQDGKFTYALPPFSTQGPSTMAEPSQPVVEGDFDILGPSLPRANVADNVGGFQSAGRGDDNAATSEPTSPMAANAVDGGGPLICTNNASVFDGPFPTEWGTAEAEEPPSMWATWNRPEDLGWEIRLVRADSDSTAQFVGADSEGAAPFAWDDSDGAAQFVWYDSDDAAQSVGADSDDAVQLVGDDSDGAAQFVEADSDGAAQFVEDDSDDSAQLVWDDSDDAAQSVRADSDDAVHLVGADSDGAVQSVEDDSDDAAQSVRTDSDDAVHFVRTDSDGAAHFVRTDSDGAAQDDYSDFAMALLSAQSDDIQEDDPPRTDGAVDAGPSVEPRSQPVGGIAVPSIRLAASPETELITVSVGRSEELSFEEPIDRVTIQDPDVVRLRVPSPRRLILTGKETGTTELTVDSGGETRSFFINVEPNLELLKTLIASVAPMADIQVMSLNGSILLTGHVPDAATSDLLKEVTSVATGADVLTHLQVAGVQQTMLRVMIAEVNKEALRELGINWAIGASDWSRSFFFANNVAQLNPTVFGSSGLADIATGQQLYSVGATGNGAGTNVTFGFPRAELQMFLNALRQNGLARTLAEPNLVAYSGQTATFLAGGEVPIPVAQGGAVAGAISVTYKEFGVRLAFTPTVLGGQLIRLHVMSEISDATPSDQLAGGLPLFTFTTRRVESTIECGNGQTFIIAGLLRENVRATVSKIPGLGDLPVLGALFSSTSYQNSETELLILVTPQLVEPLDPDQVPELPGARMTHPSDHELFSLQQLQGTPREPASAGLDEWQDAETGSLGAAEPGLSGKTTLHRLTSSKYDLRGPWGFEIDDDGK